MHLHSHRSTRVGGTLPDQQPRPCAVLFRYRMVAVGAYGPPCLVPTPEISHGPRSVYRW